MLAATLVAVLLLASIHLFVPAMRFLHVVPRSRWLSLAGGAAVAYVFLHILPELASHEKALGTALGEGVYRADQTVYAVALVGLVVFYGLERMIRSTNAAGREDAFRVHLASFTLYNALIGYLLVHREETGLLSLALFAVAMGLHFLTTDHALYVDHESRYSRWGRFLLVGALGAGTLLGLLTTVPEWVVALLFSLLAGGVLLNVLKEELPAERQSRFSAFVVGVTAYGALLWAV